MATLRISPDKVCFVVVKAREFDAKVAPTELDEGSNASDDKMTQTSRTTPTTRPSRS